MNQCLLRYLSHNIYFNRVLGSIMSSKLITLGEKQIYDSADENEKVEILVFKRLKKILEETSSVLHFKPKIFHREYEVNPDILWIYIPTSSVLVLEVKAWSYEFLKCASVEPGGHYININGHKFENPLHEVDRHKRHILDKLRSVELEDAIVDYAIVFPNLTMEEFKHIDHTLKHHIDVGRCIFKDDLKDKDRALKKLARLIHFRYGNSKQLTTLSDDPSKISKIRKALFPELVIGKDFLRTTSNDIPILDVIQEKLLRNVSRGLRILRGAPGSGKTVTLVGKAIYEKLYEKTAFGTRRILILTFTRILAEDIRDMIQKNIKYNKLGLSVYDFDINTMHSLTRKLCNRYNVKWDTNEVIDTAIERLLEIDFDDEDKYDVILCDEVQDFGKNWFKLIDRLKKENSIVILCVDETQRIYDRSIWRWKDVGIEARGRVLILRKSYRTPTKFLRASVEFIKRDRGLIKELKELEGINLDEIESVKDTEDNIKLYIGNEYEIVRQIIDETLNEGYKYGDIYVLSPFKWHIRRIYEELSKYLNKDVLHLVDSDSPIFDKKSPKDKILLTTYVSSKGLENRVVIVTGTHLLPRRESEKNPHLTFKQVERIDRRRLYVAMTRARDKLFLTAYKMEGFAKELCELREYIHTYKQNSK